MAEKWFAVGHFKTSTLDSGLAFPPSQRPPYSNHPFLRFLRFFRGYSSSHASAAFEREVLFHLLSEFRTEAAFLVFEVEEDFAPFTFVFLDELAPA